MRSRSPRARRARLQPQAHNAPFINSPRAPPQALGPPPKALTPCWHPRNYYSSQSHRPSPSDDYKRRMSDAKQYKRLHLGNSKFGPTRNTFNKVDNANNFSRFLVTTNMPIKKLLPRLHGLNREQIVNRVSASGQFKYLMEKFQAKALGSKMTSGDAARALIDPSAHAWGDKSPRFVRTRGNHLLLSTLSYRCSPLATADAERDTFYVS